MWKKPLLTGLNFAILGLARTSVALTIENPIKANSFPELLQNLTRALLPLAVAFGGVALIFGGFRFITAAVSGDAKKLSEAKTMFWWILIGTAIAVGALALADAAVNFARTL